MVESAVVVSEAALEQAVHDYGFWAVHLCRSAVIGFCAALGFFVLLRLLILALAWPKRLGGEVPAVAMARGQWLALAAATAVAFGSSAFYLVKPDEFFYLSIARRAALDGRHGQAIRYLQVLVSWGSRRAETYDQLADSLLALDRYHEAVAAMDRADALRGETSVESAIRSGFAHAALGETNQARTHLLAALDMVSTPEQRADIEARLRALSPAEAVPPQ